MAKGGSVAAGGIIYSAVLEFPERLQAPYLFCLDAIRAAEFQWIGKPAENIPREYDDLLKSSNASDLYSFASYYSLGIALRKRIMERKSPLPPARMIRPTILVYWNALKGGVDEYSRAMKTFSRNNACENPIVSVIGRLIFGQINNSGVLQRIVLARAKNRILPNIRDVPGHMRGYVKTRRGVTMCETFGQFVRGLAKECSKPFQRCTLSFKACKSGVKSYSGAG